MTGSVELETSQWPNSHTSNLNNYWKPSFLTFKQIEKEKLKMKNLAVKKGFLSFYSAGMFVCVYVCLCVCLSVGALQTSSFHIGGWNFDIDTYM